MCNKNWNVSGEFRMAAHPPQPIRFVCQQSVHCRPGACLYNETWFNRLPIQQKDGVFRPYTLNSRNTARNLRLSANFAPDRSQLVILDAVCCTQQTRHPGHEPQRDTERARPKDPPARILCGRLSRNGITHTTFPAQRKMRTSVLAFPSVKAAYVIHYLLCHR